MNEFVVGMGCEMKLMIENKFRGLSRRGNMLVAADFIGGNKMKFFISAPTGRNIDYVEIKND